MTICIAGISEQNKIIAITDKMYTVGSQPVTKYEINENNKAICLHEKTIGLFSGDVLRANEILDRSKALIKLLQNPTVKDIAEAVNTAYKTYWKEILDNFLTMRYGFDLAVFMANNQTLNQNLVNEITKVIMQFAIDVEIIIAGIDTVPHLFMVDYNGTVANFDSVGYASIGSGAKHAQLSLIENEYNSSIDFENGFYSLLSAKKRAEYDPGVGTLCDIIVIDNQFKRYTDAEITKVMTVFNKSVSEIKQAKSNFAKGIEELNKNESSSKKR